MDDPVRDIPGVVRQLTQGSPSKQAEAIDTYFTKDAVFIHPFCRVPRFSNSRELIQGIFRWYKIMSPHIDLTINSVAFDASSLTLYVSISQTFRIFVIPLYAAPVNLITVLKLEHNKAKEKYYIQSQNDLYQTNDFVRFFWPGGWLVVWLWQVVATLVCYVLAFICQPISWIEEFYMPQGWYGVSWR